MSSVITRRISLRLHLMVTAIAAFAFKDGAEPKADDAPNKECIGSVVDHIFRCPAALSFLEVQMPVANVDWVAPT